jgi:NADP-dependent 3-hydroxy acid dehydrogenase YdfG
MDFAAIQEEVAVNYLGVLRVTRAVAPGMIAKRDGNGLEKMLAGVK